MQDRITACLTVLTNISAKNPISIRVSQNAYHGLFNSCVLLITTNCVPRFILLRLKSSSIYYAQTRKRESDKQRHNFSISQPNSLSGYSSPHFIYITIYKVSSLVNIFSVMHSKLPHRTPWITSNNHCWQKALVNNGCSRITSLQNPRIGAGNM